MRHHVGQALPALPLQLERLVRRPHRRRQSGAGEPRFAYVQDAPKYGGSVMPTSRMLIPLLSAKSGGQSGWSSPSSQATAGSVPMAPSSASVQPSQSPSSGGTSQTVATDGQLSQASPHWSPSVFSWPGLAASGQLSAPSITVSLSLSTRSRRIAPALL